jgi:Putative auto-transporter adhesin, head GIN domain
MYKRMILILSVLTLAALGCSLVSAGPINGVIGSGKVVQETRSVSGFNQIELAVSGDVYVQQGETESLTIEGEDNILPLITTEVQGSRLVIGSKPAISINVMRSLVFHITVKDLRGLKISGSGNFNVGQVQTSDMDLQISGSGQISLDGLTAQSLNASIGGSGTIQVSAGSVAKQSIEIPGSGNFNAGQLQSQTAMVRLDGSGNATVWVTDRLNVAVNGSGNVDYYGSPQVSSTINGSGNVQSRGNR